MLEKQFPNEMKNKQFEDNAEKISKQHLHHFILFKKKGMTSVKTESLSTQILVDIITFLTKKKKIN